MSSARDLHVEAVERYNADDIDGFANAHADTAVLVTPTAIARGPRGHPRPLAQAARSLPDLSLTLDTVVEQGNLVAAGWTWTGTQTGPLTLRRTKRVAPSRNRVQIKGMELVSLNDDGKILEYHMYWDGVAIATARRRAGPRIDAANDIPRWLTAADITTTRTSTSRQRRPPSRSSDATPHRQDRADLGRDRAVDLGQRSCHRQEVEQTRARS